jgi:broad specificity phosphatase PhoE
MKTILLIRHPETAMAGRFCGHSNPDLNAVGESQLESIVDRACTRQIARILSSDLLRASRAAEAIGRRTGIAVELRPGLREIGFGRWEGLTWNEIEARFSHEAALWLRIAPREAAPDGEPYEAFTARVRDEFEPILANHEDGVTAIVTHRGVMDFAMTTFFKVPKTEAWEKAAPYGAVLCLTSTPHSISEDGANHLADNYSYAMEVL